MERKVKIMTKKRRLIRILEKAARVRERGQLSFDACDMIYCALLDEGDDDNLGNAEWELGLPVLTRTNGRITRERLALHEILGRLHQ